MIGRAPKLKLLPPVHPNAGLEAEYRRRLVALVEEMHTSVFYWLQAAYRRNEPAVVALATDELPATTLRRALRELQRRWQHRFDEAAPELARYFAKAVAQRSDRTLMSILRKQGFSVRLKMTRGMLDQLHATINANVGLIKSIPQKYLLDVEGAVMRSVQAGRDLKTLTAELEQTYGVTRRRAALIARDQNNKSTAAMTRGRQMEMGVKEAVWVHSHGGREPRPTHLAAGKRRQRYNVKEGWFDPDAEGRGKGKNIFPGELINCRCVARSVIPGFVSL